MNREEKIKQLKEQLAKYEARLAIKMKGYRGVIHESALSEIRHSEVMVLRAMVDDLRKEIYDLEHPEKH
jgi:polyhydroxyalkanoate synthesis regulator phasin